MTLSLISITHTSRYLRAWCLCISLLGVLAPAIGLAQAAYPARPVKLVVSQAPGGTMDLVSRLYAEKLRDELGQPVVVENRLGASGNIATELVARSAPDGYTLIMGTNATHTINPYLFKRVAFDPVKDFTPVSMLVSAPNVVAVPASSSATSLKDLIDMARRQPGKLDYVSAGYGATGQLSMEQIKASAGISLVHIPYRGIAQAIQEVLAGRGDVLAFPPAALMPYIAAGKLRPLAVTSTRRVAQLPDVPTVQEQGLPSFEGVAWFGVLVPAGTPPDIVSRLQEASRRFMDDPQVRQRLTVTGLDANYLEGKAFASYMAADAERWKKVIRFSGASVD